MKLHEYQAKELFSKAGIPVPKGQLIHSPEELPHAISRLGGPAWVLKAQVHAGGRGKAGGIKIAFSNEEASQLAKEMFGTRLITAQTGKDGVRIRKLLIEERCNIDREFYVGLTVDRAKACPVLMVSREGGVEVEELAKKQVDAILLQEIDPLFGLQPFQAREVAIRLGLKGKDILRASDVFLRCYRFFVDSDASLVEVNPLVRTKSGDFIAIDAKVSIDDNALFRHAELEKLRDIAEEDPRELEAWQHGLSYASLSGNIGCIVNGAGLAMATMDIIKYYGGEPANFLDVGGGASSEMVSQALKILLSEPRVKAILVNIFGGIMKCDVLAAGLIAGASQIEIRVPMVVRLEGTQVEEGRRILRESGLKVIAANNLADAAEKVVAAVGGEK